MASFVVTAGFPSFLYLYPDVLPEIGQYSSIGTLVGGAAGSKDVANVTQIATRIGQVTNPTFNYAYLIFALITYAVLVTLVLKLVNEKFGPKLTTGKGAARVFAVLEPTITGLVLLLS